MRGYFGIGVEQISKEHNAGALFRTAHAFGAAFVFTVSAAIDTRKLQQVDTSAAEGHMPVYDWASPDAIVLPKGCVLVGIELTQDAAVLPSFRHPLQAAYVLGPERGSLSPEMLARCAFTVKIPTKFCVNVGLAGAITMYDRLISLGRHLPRPGLPGGPTALPVPERHGDALRVRKARRRAARAAEAADQG